MPSALTHAFLGVVGAKTFLPGERRTLFWLLCIFCSVFPDVDVLAFSWEIPYTAILGHRGFTHSFFFAFVLAVGLGFISFPHERHFSKAWWARVAFFFFLTSAHGILDALTDGGQGVAFLWPFDPTRFFLPWRPLRVSPLGLDGFFTPWGMEVLRNEILWVWLPAFSIWAVGRGLRRVRKLQREKVVRLAAS